MRLLVSSEVLDAISASSLAQENLTGALYALDNQSFTDLCVVVTAGREMLSDSDYEFSYSEIYEIKDELGKIVSDEPTRSRLELIGNLAIHRYISAGRKELERIGVEFIGSREFWTAKVSGSKERKDPDVSGKSLDARRSASSTSFTYNTKVSPTEEQQILIDAVRLGEDSLFKAEAFAGTGKTTLCGFVGDKLSSRSMVYLAFNRDMADQAKRRLHGVVDECRTIDSLAFSIMKPWEIWGADRLDRESRMPIAQISDRLGLPRFVGTYKRSIVARQILQTVQNFCYSPDQDICYHHVPEFNWPVGAHDSLLGWAKELWGEMLLKNGTLPVKPFQVMKYWQLSGGEIERDLVLFDEAQDANGSFMEILKSSNTQRVLIGDHHQQLYDWRGALNAMEMLEGTAFPLTRTWRFGEEIAQFANDILARKHNRPLSSIKGNPGISSEVCLYDHDDEPPEWPFTVLCRTNASVFRKGVEIAKNGHRVHIHQDFYDMKRLILDALSLFKGHRERVSHPLILKFADWVELEFEADELMDPEIRRVRTLVEEHHSTLLEDMNTLTRMHVARESESAVVLSTTHRVKGLEWERVMLWDDFLLEKSVQPNAPVFARDAELNVLYVAATRATRELFVPRGLLDRLNQIPISGGV